MTFARLLASILLATIGATLIACQSDPEPTFPTVPATRALALGSTATAPGSTTPAMPSPDAPTPAESQSASAPDPSPDPTPAISLGTLPPPPFPTPEPVPPTPTVVPPTLSEVPVTEGPVIVNVMPSRDHFPNQWDITAVVPEGYNTVPPTSGQHWDAWSDCGFYNYPLPDELLVHNLEHGNIIVSYNLNDEADIQSLRDAVDAIPLAAEYAIVRRYHRIPEGMVAITTWGVLDRMMGVDPERIARFFRDYPGNTGPEFPNGLPCTTGIRMPGSSGG